MFKRPMAFAGSWYPADSERCEARLRNWFDRSASGDPVRSRYGVVPHAGWVYSGGLAARVFQALPDDPGVDLAIVMGGHLRTADPLIAMTEGSWDTPFGALPIFDGLRPGLEALSSDGLRVVFEDAHQHFDDNSTELQLPFVKFRYPGAKLLPLRVPPGEAAIALGRVLSAFLNAAGLNTVVIASTDLTHYGPAYGFEPKGRGGAALHWVRGENDHAFLEAMAGGDSREMLRVAAQQRNACSPGAVAALNEIVRGASAGAGGPGFRVLEYATSQDIKPHDGVNFVGYVGGVFGG